MSKHKFETLDALRGVAACAVVIRHAPTLFPGVRMEQSHLAVDLFFVLSGFVICHAYERKLAAGLNFRRFMTTRLIRLYPLYLLAALIAIVIGVVRARMGQDEQGGAAGLTIASLVSLTMAPDPWSSMLYPLNAPTWSLAYELLINAVYVLAFALFRRPVFLMGLAGVASLAVLFSALREGHLDLGYSWATAAGGLARVTLGFTLGLLIYRVHVARPHLRMDPWLALACVPLLMWISPPGVAGVLYEWLCATAIFPLLILLAAGARSPRRGTPIFLALGAASYGLYILHYPVIFAVSGAATRILHVSGDQLPIALGVATLATLAVGCVLIDRWLDQPFRRWLSARLLGPRGGGAPALALPAETALKP